MICRRHDRARLAATFALALALALALAAAAGCSGGTSTPPGTVACETTDECPGDYVCEVNRCFPPGYEGSRCEFIVCGANAACQEGPPAACACTAGYDGDGFTCADANECATGADDCSDDATCTNTAGGFTCACHDGFTGDGRTCVDVDECAEGTDDCGANAVCTNTPGGFSCACADGWEGDGHSCANVDECAEGTDDCSADADCLDTDGSFTCDCHDGFDGDGVTCADIDECAPTSPCGAHATCTNLAGTYSCACDLGYYGDGLDCRESWGQIVWMGHDLYERNADVDRIVGNAVAQATTLGTIQVLGYRQYADASAGGEVENTDAAIAARLAELGRAATITHVDDYMAVPAALATTDVLLVYEMENGGDALAIGELAAPYLRSFLDGGGVIVVMDHYSGGSALLDASGVMRFLGMASGYADVPVTVTVPSDPVMAGVAATYTGTNGSAEHATNDGTIAAVGPGGYPVVVHKVWNRPRFDGTFGAAWETLAAPLEDGYGLMSDHPAHIPDIYNMYDATGQRYSPEANTWTHLVAAGPTVAPWFQLAPVGMHLFGFVAYATSIYRYDTRSDAWTALTPWTGGGTNEYTMAAADEAGRVYGYASNGNLLVYDPIANSVSTRATGIPALRGSGNLYETRLVYDPGTRSIYLGAYYAPELYRFELDGGATTQLTSIPEDQLNDIFCGDRAGHIYAAGAGGGTTMFQYDIAADAWSALPDLPSDHGNDGTCVVSDDGWLYVTTGSNGRFYRLPLH